MTFGQAMDELERLGTAQNRKIYARHGVPEPMFGVSYVDQGKLAKRAGTNHELAKQLWSSGNHDARILAAKIADPSQADHALLEEWAAELDCYPLTDAFASFAAASPLAKRKREKWRKSKKEWIGAAGWSMVAIAAMDKEVDNGAFAGLIEAIEQGIGKAKNRMRHAMNSALIAIGARPAFTKTAIAAAKRIGKVEVDHGETSCKTPDAESYIRKMIARNPGR